jgi:hypothetical protein
LSNIRTLKSSSLSRTHLCRSLFSSCENGKSASGMFPFGGEWEKLPNYCRQIALTNYKKEKEKKGD